MNTTRYVAAIEISSSKVIGAVGRIYPDGKLEVIAIEQEKCVECVRAGIVQNVEETAMRISRILTHLELNKNVAPHKITGVFIGLSGRSLHSIAAEVELSLPDEMVIDRETVQRLRSRAEEKAIDSSLEVIDAVPRFFTIGNTKTKEPVGNLGTDIKAIYDLIVCRPQLKRNIERTGLTDRLGIRNHGFIVTPLATGQLIPSESEKRLGCMLVDMGAETTSVSIYKDGNMIYFATLPLGSRNITRDITTLNLLEESAEEIKIQSGNAIPSGSSTKLNIHGVDMGEISEIVVARAEEIMVNILEQIKYAGLEDKDLPGGIILIGGGVRLNNMEELIRNTSKLPVRRGHLPDTYISIADKNPSLEALQVISILYAGAVNSQAECLTTAAPRDLPENDIEGDIARDTPERTEQAQRDKQPRNTRFGSFLRTLKGVLTPGDEDDDDELD